VDYFPPCLYLPLLGVTPAAPTPGEILPNQFTRDLVISQLTARLAPLSAEDAELATLRGLFALEAGDTAKALKHFHNALALTRPTDRYVPFLPMIGTLMPLENIAAGAVGSSMSSGVDLEFPSHGIAVYYLNLLESENRNSANRSKRLNDAEPELGG